jgi:hypothetical protein
MILKSKRKVTREEKRIKPFSNKPKGLESLSSTSWTASELLR